MNLLETITGICANKKEKGVYPSAASIHEIRDAIDDPLDDFVEELRILVREKKIKWYTGINVLFFYIESYE